jgi:hypothetical protein
MLCGGESKPILQRGTNEVCEMNSTAVLVREGVLQCGKEVSGAIQSWRCTLQGTLETLPGGT